jgi:hypothetical protein
MFVSFTRLFNFLLNVYLLYILLISFYCGVFAYNTLYLEHASFIDNSHNFVFGATVGFIHSLLWPFSFMYHLLR